MHSSQLYNLLISPSYRIGRHLIFVIMMAVIVMNQTFIAYQDCKDGLGNNLYLIALLSFIAYLLITYFNYFVLTPKYLIPYKYKQYLLSLSGFVILLICLNLYIELRVREGLDLGHRIQDYTNPLILVDSLSTSMITIVCVGSMSMITLFRLSQKQQHDINTLEINLLQTELGKLKGQLSPALLSTALRQAASKVKIEGEKSSDILILVGKLLRYQLYDCSKEYVFVTAEIHFITNLMTLHKHLNAKGFHYVLHIGDYLQSKKIVPLMLAMIPQIILERGKIRGMDLHVDIVQDELTLRCTIDGEIDLQTLDFYMFTEKLALYYPDTFRLQVDSKEVSLNLGLI